MVLGRDPDPLGALQQPADGEHRLRPRQGSPRAGVDSAAEREVVPGIRPPDVELARVGYVDLDDGVRTLADIREGTMPLRPDMRVELGLDGDDWFFAPAAGE